MNQSIRSSALRLRALVIVSVVALAACTSSNASTAPTIAPASQVAAPSAAATSVASASTQPTAESSLPASPTPAASTAGATGVATAADPCQLVTSDEAGTLAGASFGPGEESTDASGTRICSYGQEGVVFEVITATGTDPAAAKQQEDEAKAQLEANAPGFPYKLTELPGFAPGTDAAVVEGSASFGGTTMSGIAIYLVKGTTFVGISDISTLGAKAPSSAQMQDQAKVTLGRLP